MKREEVIKDAIKSLEKVAVITDYDYVRKVLEIVYGHGFDEMQQLSVQGEWL